MAQQAGGTIRRGPTSCAILTTYKIGIHAPAISIDRTLKKLQHQPSPFQNVIGALTNRGSQVEAPAWPSASNPAVKDIAVKDVAEESKTLSIGSRNRETILWRSANMTSDLQSVNLSVIASWPTPDYVDSVRRTCVLAYAGTLQAATTLFLGSHLFGLDDVSS
ncbi:Hypothetical predicted protein [Lecanosticta acicola]|uniref:Uncharacterized protein n=1 Tax=Lecanosticta acicola TaxID=111012 RepID=A0AAI8Z2S0_9PEZI|nr:Hypothetical predicted protein [Lecanosticta acicola]